MPGISPVLCAGPDTYEVSAAVKGGMVVEADGTTGKVKPAVTGALDCLGVALNDAEPVTDPSGTTGYGQPVIDISRPDVWVSVAYGGMDVRVTYQANATLGQSLVVNSTAAGGQVAPMAADGDPRLIVGICTEKAGVTAGSVGRMRTV